MEIQIAAVFLAGAVKNTGDPQNIPNLPVTTHRSDGGEHIRVDPDTDCVHAVGYVYPRVIAAA